MESLRNQLGTLHDFAIKAFDLVGIEPKIQAMDNLFFINFQLWIWSM